MITHCHKNSFHLISGAKLCLFHISAKGFFPCARPQCYFLDLYQLQNVK